ncbi:cation transporter, partial [Clostridiaceae bacterium OttesenSCG-928-D20]|nr:cation transporter [Clostridiaceae bacterium OttesenSCG-928-D20]
MKKETFDITGMTCSACSSRVEKTVSGLSGVDSLSVNLLKNSMTVSYDETALSSSDIIKSVENSGYDAFLKTAPSSKKPAVSPSDAALDEKRSMKNRLILSILFTLPLFYISMGEMYSWPLPSFLMGHENALVFALTQLLLSIPVIFIGRSYFVNGIRSLSKRSPNMDSLIAVGSGASFIYSVYAVYKMAWGMGHSDFDMVHSYMMSLYFESSAMILTLITLGKFFEARAKGKTSEAITRLMDLTPKTALIFKDGVETEISVDEVSTG